MKEISKKEEKLIELSEQKNPYAKECPNRHLWSEGFRSGYNYAKDKVVGLIKSDIESESNKDLQEADSAEEWFNGHFNCYADTWEDNYDTEPPTKVEGSVIPALTLGAFLEYARVKVPEDKNIESLVLKYIESELLESKTPFHWQAEISSGLKDFAKWVINYQKAPQRGK